MSPNPLTPERPAEKPVASLTRPADAPPITPAFAAAITELAELGIALTNPSDVPS